MVRHILRGSKQGGEEAAGLGPLSRKKHELEWGPQPYVLGFGDVWLLASSKAEGPRVELSQ